MGNKLSYPALLDIPPLFHELSFNDIENLCVNSFINNSRRKQLLTNFKTLIIDVLERENISCNIWIDGSISTEKEEPDDIDLVIELPPSKDMNMYNNITTKIFNNRTQREFHDEFHYDVYFFTKNNDTMYKYWSGFFSHNRDDSPKGIILYKINGGI